jgi:hypothetical protein
MKDVKKMVFIGNSGKNKRKRIKEERGSYITHGSDKRNMIIFMFVWP